MIGVIVCTHSTLEDVLKNAIDMIVGTQENFDVFCFMNGDDVDELREKLDRAVEKYEKKKMPCCILVDLFASTRFNAAIAISMQKGVDVITGVNLPLMMDILLSRTMFEDGDIHAFLEHSLNSVKDSMKVYNGMNLGNE